MCKWTGVAQTIRDRIRREIQVDLLDNERRGIVVVLLNKKRGRMLFKHTCFLYIWITQLMKNNNLDELEKKYSQNKYKDILYFLTDQEIDKYLRLIITLILLEQTVLPHNNLIINWSYSLNTHTLNYIYLWKHFYRFNQN